MREQAPQQLIVTETKQIAEEQAKSFEGLGVGDLAQIVALSDVSGDTVLFNQANDALLDTLLETVKSQDLPVEGNGQSQEKLLNSVIELIEIRTKEQKGLLNPTKTEDSPSLEAPKNNRISRDQAKKILGAKIVDDEDALTKELLQNGRDRIDPEVVADWMISLKQHDVPDEILQDFPAEFFYKTDDVDRESNLPDSFEEWLDDNPETQNKLQEKGLIYPAERIVRRWEKFDSKGASRAQSAYEMKYPEPKTTVPRKNLKKRLKELWNADPAVKFNVEGRIGHAVVDESEREYSKKYIFRAVGAVALIAGGYALIKFGVNPFDHNNGGPKSSPLDQLPSGNSGRLPRDVLESDPSSILPKTPDVVTDKVGDSVDKLKTVRLRSNETIWQYAEQALRDQGIDDPTNEQILTKTRSTLASNGLSWDEARRLPTGFKFKI